MADSILKIFRIRLKIYSELNRILETQVNNDNDSTIYCLQVLNEEKCLFDEKFKKCINSSFLSNKEPKYLQGIYKDFFVLKWLQNIVIVYFRTFFCILGFITNILSIKTIRKEKNKKEFKSFMYKNIMYNSIFNCLYCLINLFSLLNLCIFPRSSFCSAVYKNQFSQYFNIYINSFLGNSVRICCNFSHIIYSISRFSIISSTKIKLLDKIEHINSKKFNGIFFIVGSIWNIFRIFEKASNQSYTSVDQQFPYHVYCLSVYFTV